MKLQGTITLLLIVLFTAAVMVIIGSAADGARVMRARSPLSSPLVVNTIQNSAAYTAYLPMISHPQYKGQSTFSADVNGTWSNLANGLLITGASFTKIRWASLDWSDVETVAGALAWPTYADQQLAAISADGMAIDLIVRTVPWWARVSEHRYITDTRKCGPPATEYYTAFATFLGNVINHYAPPTYTVAYYEVFNEPEITTLPDPNNAGYVGCFDTGKSYAEFLKTAYTIVKASHPDVNIVNGGFTHPPNTLWEQDFVVNGGAGATDVFMYHLYEYAASNGTYSWNYKYPWIMTDVQSIRSMLTISDPAHANAPLGMNEGGLVVRALNDPDCLTTPSISLTVQRRQQSYYMAVTGALAVDARLKSYNWWRPQPSGDLFFCQNFNTWWVDEINASSGPANAVYTAAKTLQFYVGEGQSGGWFTDTLGAGISHVVINQPYGPTTWVVWNNTTSTPVTYTATTTPTEIHDVWGAPISATQVITLSDPHRVLYIRP